MKKYLLLFSVSMLASSVGSAWALSASEQLKATKEIFVNEFHKMDTNKDNKISLDEYLSYQFENFRANIIEAEGFDSKGKIKATETTSKASVKDGSAPHDEMKSLSDVNKTLQEMADYDIELDEDLSLDEDWGMGEVKAEEKGLTKEDVMPEADILSPEILSDTKAVETSEVETPPAPTTAELDLSVSEDESLKNLLAEINETPEEKAAKQKAEEEKLKAEAEAKANAEKAAADAAEREKQIGMMLETIKKTLPKKIDEITTWTDIEYQDNVISYIYEANIDISNDSEAEKAALTKNIESEACGKAYQEMCPKIKPMFINEGINMRIRYRDKVGNEFGKCEFNQETCK